MDGKLKEMTDEKLRIEKELSDLKKQIDHLDETEGYNKGLVDSEGFPRADLEYSKLHDYKLLKRRFNELQNDHKALMVDLEKQLYSLHEEYAKSGQAQKDIEEYEAQIDNERLKKKQKEIEDMNELLKQKAAQKEAAKTIPIPFCQITVVMDNSPAYQGGIRENDLLTRFGGITSANFSEINQIVDVVRNNINQEIPIALLRVLHEAETDLEDSHTYKGKHYKFIETKIVPRKWEGEGVLGCRFAQII